MADPALLGQWLALCVYGFEDRLRNDVIRESLDALDRMALNQPSGPALEATLDTLRAETRSGSTQRPGSVSQARNSIYRLLKEARAHHGDKGFGSWWRIHSVIQPLRRERAGDEPAYTPTSSDLTEHIWEEARCFLDETLVPAMHAVAYLVRTRTRVNREMLSRGARDVGRAFEEARRCAAMLATGSTRPHDLEQAWKRVRSCTLLSSVDLLFSQQWECILGEADVASVGLLDYFLPQVVLEPVSVLLHSFGVALDPQEHCVLRVNSSALDELVSGALLGEQIAGLHRMWRSSRRIPLFWEDPPGLILYCRILAGNIRQHGARAAGLSVEVELDEERLRVAVGNSRSLPPKHGSGSGHPQMEAIAARLGGTFVWDINEKTNAYSAHLDIPIKMLELPALGGQR